MVRYYRTFDRSFRYRVLLYFYRNRKRSIDAHEIARVFKITGEESLLLLRALQENMMLRNTSSDTFVLSDKTKSEFNAVRNAAIVVIVVAILAIYTFIIRSFGIGRY